MKTQYIIINLFLVLFCFSCEEFLEEDPRGTISPENFFNSEADFEQAVNGLYAILKNNSLYGQAGLDHFYDNGADIIEPSRTISFFEPIANYSMNEALADVSVQKMSVSDTWKDLYRIVFNANIILDRAAGNNVLNEATRTRIVAEITFLRALAYWHITNLWGDAPYYRTPLEIDEVNTLGRTSEEVIINDIIDDLQFAQDNMLAVPQRGRASKWAAAMVMAKIYLKEKNWQGALDKCKEIIEESGHQLLPTYAAVFDPANEYNAEIIWSLDFAKDIKGQFEEGVPVIAGNGNWRPSLFNPRLIDEPLNKDDRKALRKALTDIGQAFNGTGLQVASKDFAEKFPLNDLRRPLNVMDNYLGFDLRFP